MLPPQFYENPVKIKGNQFCVFPIHVDGKEIKFILSIDSEFAVE